MLSVIVVCIVVGLPCVCEVGVMVIVSMVGGMVSRSGAWSWLRL